MVLWPRANDKLDSSTPKLCILRRQERIIRGQRVAKRSEDKDVYIQVERQDGYHMYIDFGFGWRWVTGEGRQDVVVMQHDGLKPARMAFRVPGIAGVVLMWRWGGG